MTKRPSKRVEDARVRRVKWAWDSVDAACERKRAEYLTEARKLPARLLGSGLGQTMAYLYSKTKREDESRSVGRSLLFHHLRRRVADTLGRSEDSLDCMAAIVGLSATEYRRLSREMLASSEWLKRFADGRLGSP